MKRIIIHLVPGAIALLLLGCSDAPVLVPAPGDVAMARVASEINATATSATAISVTWADVSSTESFYEVHRSTSAGGPFVHVSSQAANTTSYNDVGLAPATQYCYKVRYGRWVGRSNTTYGSFSSVACATTLTLPTPTNVRARPFGGSVEITWTASSAADVNGYKLERAPSPAGPWEQRVGFLGGLRYTELVPDVEQQLCYRVTALAGAGGSAPSEPFCTADPRPPSALVAVGTETFVNITWVDNSGVEDGFEIYRTEIFDQIKVTLGRVAANVTAFRDDAVVTGRIYSYEVAATRDGGVSYIPAPSVTETTNGPPPAPTITASPQDGFVVVSWAPIGGAQWYRIERSIDDGSTWIEAGTTVYAWQTEFWDEPFIIEQQLCYRVFAINSKGASATASNVACTIPVAAPTDVNATWNGNVVAPEVELRWTDNSSWEDGYQILRYPGLPQNEGWDLIAELPPNATSYRDARFWTSGSYSYYVRAKKGGGGSYSINVYVWVETSSTGGARGAIGALRSQPIKAPAMRASSLSGQVVRREVLRRRARHNARKQEATMNPLARCGSRGYVKGSC